MSETTIIKWYDDPEQCALARRVFLNDATEDECQLFKATCKRTGLDPFARQIYATFRKSKRNGQWTSKMEIQSSIDGFRVVAERSGEYQGQTAPLWCGKDGKWVDAWLQSEPPAACKIGVYRKGFIEALVTVACFDSYAQYTKGEGDNAPMKLGYMWAKMPDLMIQKCAEALALRKAFPQDLSGLYTSDEMAQSANPDPEEKPQLPKTQPLPLGSFQNAKVIEDPSKADWPNFVCKLGKSGGKVKGKRLGELGDEILKELFAEYDGKDASTEEGQKLKAALMAWREDYLSLEKDELP